MSMDLVKLKQRMKIGRVRGFGPLWSEVDELVAKIEWLTNELDAAMETIAEAEKDRRAALAVKEKSDE